MNFPPASWVICAVSAAIAAGTAAVRAADDAERTMFWPPDFQGTEQPAPAVASPLDHFEFRGVLTIGAETFVTLVDTTNRRTLTAAVGDTIDGVTVVGFQSESGSVLLTAGEQSKRLALPDAKIVAVAPPNFHAPTGASAHFGGLRRRHEPRRQMLEARPAQVAPPPTR